MKILLFLSIMVSGGIVFGARLYSDRGIPIVNGQSGIFMKIPSPSSCPVIGPLNVNAAECSAFADRQGLAFYFLDKPFSCPEGTAAGSAQCQALFTQCYACKNASE